MKTSRLPQYLSTLVCVLAFTIPALSLSFNWTTSRGLALLSLVGLLARVLGLVSPGPVPRVLKSLLVLSAVTAALGIYHGEHWGVFHLPLYIMLAYPAYWAFLLTPRAWRLALCGAMVGAVAGAVISVLNGGLSGTRNVSGAFNPIPFGGMALVLAMASLSAWRCKPESAPSWLWSSLCATGFCAGVLTSLLSGSKAGWLSFILVPLTLIWALRSQISARYRRSIWLALTGGALLFAALALWTPVGTRLSDAMQGIQNYVSAGKVTEGSIGPRLELWRYGLSVLPQAPLLGMGKKAMLVDMHLKSATGLYDAMLTDLHTLHNEFLHMLITNGVVGLLALLAVYAALLQMGQAALNQGQLSAPAESKDINARVSMTQGLLAVSLCMIYLALGVGEVALGLNDLRNFFLFWLTLIVAMFARAPVTVSSSAMNVRYVMSR